MANGNTIRLPLCEVLKEELQALEKGVRPDSNESPWRFQVEHLWTDSTGNVLFLNTLSNPKIPLSLYLQNRLQKNLKVHPYSSTRDLISDLNEKILTDPDLYNQQRFPEKELSLETRKLLGLHNKGALQGDDLVYLNRRLLEDASPDAFKKIDRIHENGLKEVYRDIHEKKLTALCLSGGGVRSATFNLGVLQALAEHPSPRQNLAEHPSSRQSFLEQFHYLSTVSGGGYVAAWLEAWIKNEKKGITAIVKDLTRQSQATDSPSAHEPAPLRHLREHSNAMTPRPGLLSVDTWTALATYARNLLLNWTMLIPLLAAFLMLPRFMVATIRPQPDPSWLWTLVPPSWWWTLVLLAGFSLGACALVYMGMYRSTIYRRRPRESTAFYRANARRHFINHCWLPLIVATVALTTSWAWFPLSDNQSYLGRWWIWGFIGAVFHLICAAVCEVRLRWKGVTTDHKDGWWELFAVVVTGIVGGLLAWIFATKIFPHPVADAEYYACFAVPLFLALFLISATLFVGLMSRTKAEKEDEDREWWARSSAWILIAALGWSVVSALVIFGPVWLSSYSSYYLKSLGGLSGVITLLLGWGGTTPANTPQKEKASPTAVSMNIALKMIAPLFIAFLIVLFSLGTSALIQWFASGFWRDIEGMPSYPPFLLDIPFSWQSWQWVDFPNGLLRNTIPFDIYSDHLPIVLHSPLLLLLTLFVLMAGIGVIMALFINVNKFSLHALYRNRLIRSYLGASNQSRKPDPFTGFDHEDNVRMHQLPLKPFHVVNIALNLVKGDNLAWQQRKAESFTVTPLHAGNRDLGYRLAKEYGKNEQGEGISLGTAVAISGAAASPNMGYHSSPTITFLLSLFNVRLGWWLGNPGVAGSRTFSRWCPKFAIRPLLAETFGLTNDTNPYVYLSDGGHFENLGLYEMVRRRCHFIIVSDAGFDPDCQFEDLGNAIRKIRVDFGVPIELRPVPLPLYSRKSEKPGKCCAVGTIRYSEVDGKDAPDGVLVYIKPVFYGKESLDVFHYAQANKGFPHEPTSDLWFNESQFESYRRLGFYVLESAMTEICGEHWELSKKSIDDFAERAHYYEGKGKVSDMQADQTVSSDFLREVGNSRGKNSVFP